MYDVRSYATDFPYVFQKVVISTGIFFLHQGKLQVGEILGICLQSLLRYPILATFGPFFCDQHSEIGRLLCYHCLVRGCAWYHPHSDELRFFVRARPLSSDTWSDMSFDLKRRTGRFDLFVVSVWFLLILKCFSVLFSVMLFLKMAFLFVCTAFLFVCTGWNLMRNSRFTLLFDLQVVFLHLSFHAIWSTLASGYLIYLVESMCSKPCKYLSNVQSESSFVKYIQQLQRASPRIEFLGAKQTCRYWWLVDVGFDRKYCRCDFFVGTTGITMVFFCVFLLVNWH